ncbi:MAG TPA: hypothetical protein VFW80_13380 [Gaiellaceae bacterium]|nr:hypothetical protein [Gaiellaceae bacterium]
MLIRLSDPTLVDDLCESFRRAGFSARSAGGSMAEVERPDAPERDQERREVELHLRVWLAMHPDVAAELVD